MRRITVRLMFEKDSEADEVWGALKNYLKNKQIKSVVNEKSFIEYHECGHDNTPPTPCATLERFER